MCKPVNDEGLLYQQMTGIILSKSAEPCCITPSASLLSIIFNNEYLFLTSFSHSVSTDEWYYTVQVCRTLLYHALGVSLIDYF
jgi:hypothetical protein